MHLRADLTLFQSNRPTHCNIGLIANTLTLREKFSDWMLLETSPSLPTSMLMLRVRPAGDHASAFRYRAPDVLELNRGVADREAVAEHGIQPLQNTIAGRRRNILDQGVAAQRVRAGTQAPDVQIVHIQHARHLPHGADHRMQLDAAR